MGNYCSSGQKKKDKDNISEESYQLADKSKKQSEGKEISATQDTTNNSGSQPNPTNTNGLDSKPQPKALHNVQSITLSVDSMSSSPLAISPPAIPLQQNLPQNLTPLYGRPTTLRRTEKYKKIVFYILSSDDGYQTEKAVLRDVYKNLNQKCQSKGFELHVSDLHVMQTKGAAFDVNKWFTGPLEAQGGHELAANCIAEITRHTSDSYLIPILFLSSTLGEPLLPLTIERQDFIVALETAESNKHLLQKWYSSDEKSQPPCYRLNAKNNMNLSSEESEKELTALLKLLVDIFSKELRDSYLTTVVEQEINNTVLINTELSKRCIWIQNSMAPLKITEGSSSLDVEMNRRLNNTQNDLRNNLSEKHIIRIPPSIAQQQEQFATILDTCLSAEIDTIIDEHISKYSIPYCTYGVDRRLLSEIEEVNRHSRVLNENCANFSIIDKIKSYISSKNTKPMIVFGKTGAGKSVLTAKISQNLHIWAPESHLVLRYANLTIMSSDITSLIGGITEQISVLINGEPTKCEHTIQSYAEALKNLLSNSKQQIIILIDAIDDLVNVNSLNWLPITLLENIKIILTVTSEDIVDPSHIPNENNSLLNKLKELISDDDNFVYLASFTQEQWEDVLCFGGGDIYAANGVSLQLPENWMMSKEKISIQAKLLWWLAWLGIKEFTDTSVSRISEKVFIILEDKFTNSITRFIISIILASKEGLLESEIITLLRNSNLVQGSTTKLWTHFCWKMGPLFLHNKNIVMVDKTLRKVAEKRYAEDIRNAHKILFDYYENQPNLYSKGKDKCFNLRKFIELPYHRYKLDNNSEGAFSKSSYLTDLSWLYEKLSATGCVHILNDIYLIDLTDSSYDVEHIQFLKKFFEINFKALNYDAQQMHSLLHVFIEHETKIISNETMKLWYDTITNSSITRLEKLDIPDDSEEKSDDDDKPIFGYDLLMNLNIHGYFVMGLSTEREEISVWDVASCRNVRTLTGVPSPSAICPVGDHGVAVLCKREIRIIDLDNGNFKVTLKGVMNQKMPYFGLHDPSHLVCLSRNRMYVNLMNIDSGDCVTTFKAGEDRFLNSLLVSGDGRILVCGDETQKPFPLLVWHLSQKKLLYDLRIPHHDFITSLSAITHEGSYVCVVAKELNEPAPNFIVVYDLQSGTLFKKWKPSCNTVSLAISQTNTCVIAGLEDARVLIWDLVTGNCRCILTGHNAPVTLLKLDPTGKVLLSTDKEGRDKSVRLWELENGKSLAVYTPNERITTCEILKGGLYVALALENKKHIVTLMLKNGNADTPVENIKYGNPEYDGKIFNLSE